MVFRRAGNQLSLLDSTTVSAVAPRAANRSIHEATRPRLREVGSSPAAQPELPFRAFPGTSTSVAHDASAHAALERRLRLAIGRGALCLTVTDNRRTMVSIRRDDGMQRVRLHHMFLDAPPEVVTALGRYFARGDRFASKLIDRYIAAQQSRIRTPSEPADETQLDPCGEVYDLTEVLRCVSERYFDGRVQLPITWGRNGTSHRRRRSRRTIRMGTYLIDEKFIRIHPALDQAFVPRFFVEWVVYHEMLHHVVPMPVINGRRVYHSDEFRARERRFEDYERAVAWEKTYLTRLISSRGRDTAMPALPF